MKWVSRFIVIFLLVFALLTGVYFVRTGSVPWLRGPDAPPVVVERMEPPVTEPTVTGLPGLPGAGQPSSVLEALNNETVGLAKKVLPSVVSITTTRIVREVHMTRKDLLSTFFGRWFSGPAPDPQVQDRLVLGGFGSGVIVSEQGLVVTNHHVIDGMQDILLLLNDGRQLKAAVLASDPETDLAVLKVDAEGLIPLPIGDSDKVNVGEYVMAVGNPYGLHETVSLGNISAKGRATDPQSQSSEQVFLQTDAMINRGHSGGPLVNVRGELIGLTRAIFTERPNEAWQGIAFAIPGNTVRASLERILSDPDKRYRGLRLRQDVTPSQREILRLGDRRGVLVEDIAEEVVADGYGIGRLKENDFIYAANGEPTETEAAFYAQLSKASIDGHLKLEVVRGKIPLTLHVFLEPVDGDSEHATKM